MLSSSCGMKIAVDGIFIPFHVTWLQKLLRETANISTNNYNAASLAYMSFYINTGLGGFQGGHHTEQRELLCYDLRVGDLILRGYVRRSRICYSHQRVKILNGDHVRTEKVWVDMQI